MKEFRVAFRNRKWFAVGAAKEGIGRQLKTIASSENTGEHVPTYITARVPFNLTHFLIIPSSSSYSSL